MNLPVWKIVLPLSFLIFTCEITKSENVVLKEFINSSTSDEKIEYYWSKPKGNGPFPLLLMIHPEQESPKNGGAAFVKFGQVDYWTEKGFVTISISQPGYGGSTGSPDFCGPKTQNAAKDVIKHFLSFSEVNKYQIFIYGGSRGAVVASMIATTETKFAGIILKSGVYDFQKWSDLKPWYNYIKLQMLWEIGWLTNEKIKERSAYFFADKIKAPLLIIHGTKDARTPVKLVEDFVNKVNASGGHAQFVKIESEHLIPMPTINGEMENFMRMHMGPI